MYKFEITNHTFTSVILGILEVHFGDYAKDVFEASPLLGYLNNKTKAANRGSKARGAFANHYALYVVIEDYINSGFFDEKTKLSYSKYEGAKFSDLFRRQRELPFGTKLQNHALNARLNDEFKKFYPTLGKQPIVRDVEKQRYWIQEDLLKVKIRKKDGEDFTYNIAKAVINIIESYIATKKAAFENFLEVCKKIVDFEEEKADKAIEFIVEQLNPNVDARIFEIVSYALLKAMYEQQTIWIGNEKETVVEKALTLYKTGRTNANDGGIDFVMKPIGRFFQVTETTDVSKYFLDIDKVQKFPITFVIKSDETTNKIYEQIKAQAMAKYKIESVVESYIQAIEEIINIQSLVSIFMEIVKNGKIEKVMNEIVIQSKLEFNYNEEV